MRNKYEGTCNCCHMTVMPNQGVYINDNGKAVYYHTDCYVSVSQMLSKPFKEVFDAANKP